MRQLINYFYAYLLGHAWLSKPMITRTMDSFLFAGLNCTCCSLLEQGRAAPLCESQNRSWNSLSKYGEAAVDMTFYLQLHSLKQIKWWFFFLRALNGPIEIRKKLKSFDWECGTCELASGIASTFSELWVCNRINCVNAKLVYGERKKESIFV